MLRKNKANTNLNKKLKVLLRERKRHTARRVASTPYVVLTGYPPRPGYHPPWPGYPPGQGTPQPGYPLARVPPQPGYPPGQGTPPSWTWQGTPPPRLDLAGYPPLPHGILGNVAKHSGIWVPPPRCELTNKVKLLPSHRTTYAGGNKLLNSMLWHFFAFKWKDENKSELFYLVVNFSLIPHGKFISIEARPLSGLRLKMVPAHYQTWEHLPPPYPHRT